MRPRRLRLTLPQRSKRRVPPQSPPLRRLPRPFTSRRQYLKLRLLKAMALMLRLDLLQ